MAPRAPIGRAPRTSSRASTASAEPRRHTRTAGAPARAPRTAAGRRAPPARTAGEPARASRECGDSIGVGGKEDEEEDEEDEEDRVSTDGGFGEGGKLFVHLGFVVWRRDLHY